ncbi:MAG: hydroxymyristoyl-ACP dehydratase [Bacteroidales bacterium]|nr:hydroxymyristoyl-ACP dehydratase [Bacteroidales bacterium]
MVIVDKSKITEYIPQRPPMVMVDNIIFCDEKKIITTLFIDENNIFCRDGFFREPGLIENIAQTAAAKIGYLSKIKGKEVLIGYIGSIKDLIIHFLPAVNTEVTTEVSVENEVMGFTIIHGKVMSSDKIAAECEMRIFLKE